MSFRVIRAGQLTTVQDLGRLGAQRWGVSVSGAIDPVALRLANWLVGNPESAAALEITWVGPDLLFESDALVAYCGAECVAHIAGQPVPRGSPLWIRAGEMLSMGNVHRGARTVLAIAGGIDVPLVLGSRSTHVRSRLGGFHGRPLMVGDHLTVGEFSEDSIRYMTLLRSRAGTTSFQRASWSLHVPESPTVPPCTLRVIRGAHWDQLSPQAQQTFRECSLTVSSQSDRTGLRLMGHRMSLADDSDRFSEAVVCGTIQLPPGGQPILLLADCAPTGGYARIAHLITADQPLVAQLRPGETVQFEEVTRDVAQEQLRQQAAELYRLRLLIRLKQEVP